MSASGQGDTSETPVPLRGRTRFRLGLTGCLAALLVGVGLPFAFGVDRARMRDVGWAFGLVTLVLFTPFACAASRPPHYLAWRLPRAFLRRLRARELPLKRQLARYAALVLVILTSWWAAGIAGIGSLGPLHVVAFGVAGPALLVFVVLPSTFCQGEVLLGARGILGCPFRAVAYRDLAEVRLHRETHDGTESLLLRMEPFHGRPVDLAVAPEIPQSVIEAVLRARGVRVSTEEEADSPSSSVPTDKSIDADPR